MRIFPALALGAVLLPATLAARDTQTVAQVLAGRTPGPPRTCIPQSQIDDSRTFDSGAILYRMRGGPDYLNTPQGCDILRSDRGMVTRTPAGELCSGDIIRIVDFVSHFDYGSCGLGEFVPYPRIKKPKP